MTLAEKLAFVLEDLHKLPPGRAKSLAMTKLDEVALWAACAIQGVDPVAWFNGERGVHAPPPASTSRPKTS